MGLNNLKPLLILSANSNSNNISKESGRYLTNEMKLLDDFNICSSFFFFLAFSLTFQKEINVNQFGRYACSNVRANKFY